MDRGHEEERMLQLAGVEGEGDFDSSFNFKSLFAELSE